MYPILWNTFNVTSGNVSEFRQGNWDRITVSKIVVVHRILKLGYNVVFSDVDVSIVEDPMHFFLNPPFDYMHSDNAICVNQKMFKLTNFVEGNTGFYYMKSNSNAIRLYDRFLRSINISNPSAHDQILFWEFVRHPVNMQHFQSEPCPDIEKTIGYSRYTRSSTRRSAGVTFQWARAASHLKESDLVLPSSDEMVYSCHLNNCQFAPAAPRSHKRFLPYLQANGNKTFYVAHSNYVQGPEKKVMLMEHGFWLATQTADGGWGGVCKSFQPNYAD